MKVFVSATSKDLKSCRDAVKSVLLQGDIQPVTQEVLRADHRDLPDYLDALIRSCDAVICLVGKAFGAAPPDEPHRSYTQREFDCAKKLDKPIFVFLATDTFYSEGEPAQGAQEALRQRAHYDALMDEKYCRMFDTRAELEREVGVSIWSIRRAAGRIPIEYYHLPKPPPFFVGRVDEESQLRKAMADRSPGLIAVVGMPGQGKTTLVHHTVEARHEDVTFPFHAGFWCTAGLGGFSFDMFLDEALACLADAGFNKTEAPTTQQRVQRLLKEMQKRPILVVIDAIERWLRGWECGTGAEESLHEARAAAFDGLDEFLAQASALRNGSHLVVTSRVLPEVLEDVDKTVIPVRKPTDYDVGLQGLKPHDAVSMLKAFGIEADDARLGQIAGQFGYHPLALRLFGGYVKKTYGGVLERGPELDAWDRKKTLARLFDEVHEHLPGGEASRRFLSAVSCAIEDVPLQAVQAVLSQDNGGTEHWSPRDVALLLADWQVISFEARAGTVGMHAMLKEYFDQRLSESKRVALHARFARWYREQAIPDAPTTLEDVKARLLAVRHALRANDLEGCQQIVWGRLTPLHSLVEWMAAFGHYVHGAELLADFATAAHDRLRARVRIARSALLRPIGAHAEARRDLDEAIGILEGSADNLSDSDLSDLAGALSNRGTTCLELADYQAARADFDRAVQLLQNLPADEHTAFQLAAVRANRAMLLREIGLLGKAVEDCTAAIETHRTRLETVYQQLDAELASAHFNRGNAHRDLRRHEEALRDYDAAIGIHSNLVNMGQVQFRGSQALGRILHASVLADMSRHEAAISELDEAVAAYHDLIRSGKKHLEPMLAFALMVRARSVSASGDPKAALKDSGFACDIYRRLVETGRRDLQGPYTHSLLIDAVVRQRFGDTEGAKSSWQSGMTQATRLIASGETDLRLIVVRYSFEQALDVAESNPNHAVQLVATALDVIEPPLQGDEPTEGLVAESRHAISRLQAEVSQKNLPLEWGRVETLKELLDSGRESGF